MLNVLLLRRIYCIVKVCGGESKVLRASVWKPKCCSSNPGQNQIESTIQNFLHSIPSTVWMVVYFVEFIRGVTEIYILLTFEENQSCCFDYFKSRIGGKFCFCSWNQQTKWSRLVLCTFDLLHVCLG